MVDLIIDVLQFLIDFFAGQWGDLIANVSILVFALLKAAEIVTGWTPSTKDDEVVAKVREFLEQLFPEQAAALKKREED